MNNKNHKPCSQLSIVTLLLLITLTAILTYCFMQEAKANTDVEVRHGITEMDNAYICHTKPVYLDMLTAIREGDSEKISFHIVNGYCWFLPAGTKYILLKRDASIPAAFIITKRLGDPKPVDGWTYDSFK